MDLQMPEMDGVETCRRLRAQEATAFVPIIMLTAMGDDEHLTRAFEAGVDDYLVKPLQREQLVLRVKRMLLRTFGRKTPPPPRARIHAQSRAQIALLLSSLFARFTADATRCSRPSALRAAPGRSVRRLGAAACVRAATARPPSCARAGHGRWTARAAVSSPGQRRGWARLAPPDHARRQALSRRERRPAGHARCA
jgi:hypothetical protein